MPEDKGFYETEKYKKFRESLTSYEQQKEFIEIVGEAIQYGISMLSCNLKKMKVLSGHKREPV